MQPGEWTIILCHSATTCRSCQPLNMNSEFMRNTPKIPIWRGGRFRDLLFLSSFKRHILSQIFRSAPSRIEHVMIRITSACKENWTFLARAPKLELFPTNSENLRITLASARLTSLLCDVFRKPFCCRKVQATSESLAFIWQPWVSNNTVTKKNKQGLVLQFALECLVHSISHWSQCQRDHSESVRENKKNDTPVSTRSLRVSPSK